MNYLLFIQISFYIFTRSSIVFLGGTIFYQYLVSLFIDAETFGPRTHPVTGEAGKMHYGIDLGSHPEHGRLQGGEGIRSLARGTVVGVGNDSERGNFVIIDHGNGYRTIYMHIQDNGTFVAQGDKVSNGQVIAGVGSTGISTGNHLHLAMTKNGKLIDPTTIDDLDKHINGLTFPEKLVKFNSWLEKTNKKMEERQKRRAAKQSGQQACQDCERRANMEAYNDYINNLGVHNYDQRMSYIEFTQRGGNEVRFNENRIY
jgi:hypothetical protein